MSASALPGGATPSGTRRGADSFGAGARALGRTGLTVSPVGFGASRARDDAPLHRRALADALRGGVNLVDTSAHASEGRSERLVGRMIANLVQHGEIRREQLVVVSRVGQAPEEGELTADVPADAIHSLSGGGVRCLHPSFLQAQVDASLRRLGLARIDVLLLHEPTPGTSDDTLRAAFAALEGLVQQGAIGAYGLSSSRLAKTPTDADALSLQRMVALARDAGGADHHLAVIRLPLNLFELGATVPGGTLAVAAEHDLGVLGHRALEAWVGTPPSLLRIADVPEAHGDRQAADDALARVRKLEAQWADGLGQQLRVGPDDNAVDLFRWGQELSPRLDTMRLEQWTRLRHDVVATHLGQTSAALLRALEGDVRDAFAQWWERYGTTLHEAFEAIEAVLRSRGRGWARQTADALDPLLPGPWRALPLSNKAVLTALSAPVSCVAVGMRQPGYVRDVLRLREHPVRLLGAGAGPVDFDAVASAMSALPHEPV